MLGQITAKVDDEGRTKNFHSWLLKGMDQHCVPKETKAKLGAD